MNVDEYRWRCLSIHFTPVILALALEATQKLLKLSIQPILKWKIHFWDVFGCYLVMLHGFQNFGIGKDKIIPDFWKTCMITAKMEKGYVRFVFSPKICNSMQVLFCIKFLEEISGFQQSTERFSNWDGSVMVSLLL